jgi:O-antigen ligase
LFILIASFGPLNQQALSDKFSEHPTSRGTIWNVTSEAIVNFLPWGSGLGTFGDVYRTFDDPDRAGNQFVNHAHNDYFEIALELGVPGLLLVACFLLWAFLRTARAWSEDFRGAALSRAGSIMIGVVLFHSITDYPLRTSAIATIFALACAFLVPPPVPMRREEDPAASESKGLRHLEVD